MLFNRPQIYKCFLIGDELGVNWGGVVIRSNEHLSYLLSALRILSKL